MDEKQRFWLAMTLHWLRHTFGSLLTEMGVPIITVSKLCRHKSIATTIAYYLQPSEDGDGSIAQRVNDIGALAALAQ